MCEDDDIDWEAAVLQVEDVEACYYQSKQNAQLQNRATKQKTIDSFFGTRVVNSEVSGEDVPVEQCPPVEGVCVSIDPVAAKAWVYPANVPRRDYQFSITKTALFANTLVSLPTGLGKTLIAAVVIYNFYRWFPQGKIVFTAPSRPLVVQQIEACHNVVGIPQDLTTDMTGQVSPAQRADLWKCKRVFFVTPQVLEKDIHAGTCPAQHLVCLVVDEAHRAVGNYAYCTVVRELMAAKVSLRILALTATPGSKHAAVQSVIDNLNISCMEYRNEDDPDVNQYTHQRKLEVVTVPMDSDSTKLINMFIDILQPIVTRLWNYGVFHSRDIAKVTPYEFITAREKFRQAPPQSLAQAQYGEVEGCFGAGITLCHILKLLSSHGIKPAFEMLRQKSEQGLLARMMSRNDKFHQMKQLMQQAASHGAPSPKLVKLEEIVVNHFHAHDPANTRIIIFTNFRDSVKDIMEALSKLDGAVKAMEFIGQTAGKTSKGQTQKKQQQVLQKFRSGSFNTIVATCIGEEGLDIMEVDLVICFDANVSHLRMIQRMGRTGRKRDGRVVVLASEGQEHQGYLNKQAKGKAIGKHMQNGGVKSFNFHNSSRMVPHVFRPELLLTELRIEQFVPRGRKLKEDINVAGDPGTTALTFDEEAILKKYFGSSQQATWSPSLIAFPNFQLFPTPVHSVKHSAKTTSMLIDVLQELRGLPSKDSNNSVEEKRSPREDFAACPLAGDTQHGKSRDSSNTKDISDSDWEQEFESQFHSHSPPECEQIAAETEKAGSESFSPPKADVRPAEQPSQVPPHRCFFSSGAVSVTSSGHVLIASPPRLFERDTGTEHQKAGYDQSSPIPSQVPESEEFVAETPEFLKPAFVEPSSIAKAQTPGTENHRAHLEERTPVNLEAKFQESGNKSSSEVWKHRNSQLSALRKPRPLKRLKRGRELLPISSSPKKPEGKQRRKANVRFIDDEAEVSSDEQVSSDEEEDDEEYHGTFIDDHVPSNGVASDVPVDMMAIYRRSLLTQSPAEGLAPWKRFLPSDSTPSSSSVDKTPLTNSKASVDGLVSGQKSVSFTAQQQELCENVTSAAGDLNMNEQRKRRLSFNHSTDRKESCTETTGPVADVCDEPFSDDFFDDVDLDALEAEAAQQSRLRATQAADEKHPSFDLGV